MTHSNPSISDFAPAGECGAYATDQLRADSGALGVGADLSVLARAAINAAHRVNLELGYGCVDWYMYVSAAAPDGVVPSETAPA